VVLCCKAIVKAKVRVASQTIIHPLLKKKIITNESESTAELSIFYLAFRGRDADEVAQENPFTLSAS